MTASINRPDLISYDVPILIICYNRNKYISKQAEILRKIRAESVFIAADGPRNQEELSIVNTVRNEYRNEINWECSIKTRFSPVNQGCFRGVTNALNWFFSEVEEGIILEDDIVPNEDFFFYTKAMLDHFRNNRKIFCISGCNFGFNGSKSEVIFGKVMNMWGWATWADRYRQIDFSMKHWNQIKLKKLYLLLKLRLGLFDFDFGWAAMWKDIFNEAADNEDYHTWDYQFIFNQIRSGQLTVFPGVNLVRNYGFESNATHTGLQNHFMNYTECGELVWPLQLNRKEKINRHFYEYYIKEKWSFYKRPNWKYYAGNILLKLGFPVNQRRSL